MVAVVAVGRGDGVTKRGGDMLGVCVVALCSVCYVLILAMHVGKLKKVERRANAHNMQHDCRENNETIK